MSANLIYHFRREALSTLMIRLLRLQARMTKGSSTPVSAGHPSPPPASPQTPDDFRPLENACFQNPYAFYKMLRDDYPVYRLPNGIFCISRYDDIVRLSRDTEGFSSAHQGIVAGLQPGQDIFQLAARFNRLSALGLIPADVLATTDPPQHSEDRRIGHAGLNAKFVKSLETQVEALCSSMMDEFIDQGRLEFMQDFAWKLPMLLIIRLIGLPEEDFTQIKAWCVDGINSQSGIATGAELATCQAGVIEFVRYCWRHYRRAQARPGDNLMGLFARSAADPANGFNDQRAVSAIFQLLIAGSDSSATSMGNALKLLIENPQLQIHIRDDINTRLPAFIEEVFRLEAAFQGHFRWTLQDRELHGVHLPAGSRVFLMWASGNRDERYWEEPERIRLDRKNGKKHLTFGHGIHACLGRELARMEIRVVLREFLLRTQNLRIDGDAPFVASMFARTLLRLPVCFEPAGVQQTSRDHEPGQAMAAAGHSSLA